MGESKSKVSLDQEKIRRFLILPRLNQSREANEISSTTSTTRPLNTFKSAFFNFMRDFKRKHENKEYQTIMRLGARRWRAMTQAQRAPYVLEAASNRKTGKPNKRGSEKEVSSRPSKKRRTKSRQSSKHSHKSRSTSGDSGERCPTCGHRKKNRSRSGSCSSSDSSKSDKS